MNSKIIKLINDYWRFDNDQDNLSTWHDKNDLIKEIEAINFTDSSLQLKEKHKTDFDVWAINKGYTKMEGEWVKEPETYNEEFLLQMYNEENL